MSIFNLTLYSSLTICIVGSIFRIYQWFRMNVDPTDEFPVSHRISATLKSSLKTMFSVRAGLILKSIVLDLFFQIRILKAGVLRWLIHMSIFWGFIILTLFHAMDEIVTANIFNNYASTLNPYLLVRNILGLLVLAGASIALFRRLFIKKSRILNNKNDIFALGLVCIILGSGFLLEAAKIISGPIFNEMVEEYMSPDDEEAVRPLKAYWEKNFFVIFPEKINPVDADMMAEGLSQHLENCADCHSEPKAAFVSLPLSRLLSSLGNALNHQRADKILWYLHFLATFLLLALLPFSKFFHILSTSLRLIVRAQEPIKATESLLAGPRTFDDDMTKKNIRLLSLDACTHCGVCSRHCSVAPFFARHPNRYVLPSEKLLAIKKMSHRKSLPDSILNEIAEGSFICTSCYRCTQICPSGIDLQDLWEAAKAYLIKKGHSEPYHWIMKYSATQWAEKIKALTPSKIKWSRTGGFEIKLTDRPQTFSSCVQCTTCTNVCPVVAASEDPAKDLDFTPQQIMNLLRLELKEVVLGSRMVWNCLTCYMCQEHCPQGVRVTDVLYELRNQAYEKFKTVKQREFDIDRADRN